LLREFTVEWCLNCEVLNKTTYADISVVIAARKAKLARYRIDMTDNNDGPKTLLTQYGRTALPYALLIAIQGKVSQWCAGMFRSKTLADAIDQLSTTNANSQDGQNF
jgi:thiol:disulfide interchange protein DsbD